MSKPFIDIIERPPIELSGRFKDHPPVVREWSAEEIAEHNRQLAASYSAILIPDEEKIGYPVTKPVSQEVPVVVPEPPKSAEETKSTDLPAKKSGRPSPVDTKAVAKLKLEGLGNGRIAKQLGISKSAVQRAAKGMAKLHEPVKADTATPSELALVDLVLRYHGLNSDGEEYGDELLEKMEDATYRVQSERDATSLADELLSAIEAEHPDLSLRLRDDLWRRFQGLGTERRLLEFRLRDCAIRVRRNDPSYADRIEGFLPAGDREWLRKQRFSETKSLDR